MKAEKETLTNNQILERALDLLIKRNKIIDQALSDSMLLSAEATVALKEIRSELDELRAIQIANRKMSWREMREREAELRSAGECDV
jgi:CRISPR/Cas system-associated endonuclease Cas1